MERGRYQISDTVAALLGAQQAAELGADPAAAAALEEAKRKLGWLLRAFEANTYRPSYDDAVASLEMAARALCGDGRRLNSPL